MQTKGALFDAAPGLVVAFDVVQHFVAVEIAVVVWHHDRLGVEVQDAWAERADDEVMPFECLMHRRWQVVLPDDRREVIDIEAVLVVAAIPSDDIKRVVFVGVGVD